MAEQGLLLAPGVAQMYTTGEIAADLCLETPGLDTLDILVFWKGFPTVASTRTILVNAALAKAYYLEQNQYVGVACRRRPVRRERARPARDWAGAALGRHVAPGLVQARPAGRERQGARRRLQPAADARACRRSSRPRSARSRACRRRRRSGSCREQAAAVMSEMPPRENTRVNTSLDSVHASGPLGRGALRDPRQLQLQADRAAAGLRRLLPAAAAAAASRVRLRLPGVRPPRAAGRAAQLRAGDGAVPDGAALSRRRLTQGRLRCGLTDYLDKGASLDPAAPCLTMTGQHPQLRRGAAAVAGWSAGRWRGPASGPATRWRCCRATIRSRSAACSASRGPERSGARSIRGTRRPRTPELLGLLDCCLPDLRQRVRSAGAERSRRRCRACATLVCLDGEPAAGDQLPGLAGRSGCRPLEAGPGTRAPDGDVVMIAGTGGTTGQAQGRAADRAQHRDDDRAHADELSVRRAAGVPRARAAHACGRRAVLPGHGARRRDRHHAGTRTSASSST